MAGGVFGNREDPDHEIVGGGGGQRPVEKVRGSGKTDVRPGRPLGGEASKGGRRSWDRGKIQKITQSSTTGVENIGCRTPKKTANVGTPTLRPPAEEGWGKRCCRKRDTTSPRNRESENAPRIQEGGVQGENTGG